MNKGKFMNQIFSKKYLLFPLVAFILVLAIGGVAFAGTYLSKSKSQDTSNDDQTIVEGITDETATDNGLEDPLGEDLDAEFEEVPDFEQDEVYEEETQEETEEELEDETTKESEEETEKETEEEKKKSKYPYLIKINKVMNTVTVYGQDEQGEYTVPVKAIVCSTGNATPLGTYNTKIKYTWKLLNGNVWGQYSTRIHGGILFHSVPYATKNKDDLKFNYYNKLGKTASAGCVRLTTIDAKWIFDNCPVGTTVVIYNDKSSPGPLGKPSAIKLPTNVKSGWDPTDPDPKNPWKTKEPTINGVVNREIERGTEFNPLSGITAFDTAGNDITSTMVVEGSVDNKKVGTYVVNYSITDVIGKIAKATATYTVVDTKKPEIILTSKNSVIPLNTIVNTDFALGRIIVVDNGDQVIDHRSTKVDIKKDVWGYTINYSFTDGSKNVGTLTEVVTYETYSLDIKINNKLLNVDSLEKIKEADVKAAVTANLINDSTKDQKTLKANEFSAKFEPITGEHKIKVTYTYKYTSSIGEKVAEKQVILDYLKPEPSPTPSPEPTPEPEPSPEPTPETSPTPTPEEPSTTPPETTPEPTAEVSQEPSVSKDDTDLEKGDTDLEEDNKDLVDH